MTRQANILDTKSIWINFGMDCSKPYPNSSSIDDLLHIMIQFISSIVNTVYQLGLHTQLLGSL